MRRYLTNLFLIFTSVASLAGTISGKVTDENNEPLPGVTVRIAGTSLGGITDASGKYLIKNISEGQYTLTISSVGFTTITHNVSIKNIRSLSLDFVMKEVAEELDEVVVTAKSESQKVSEQPIQAISIDTRVLKAEATNTVGILTRAPGVRVRQSGGLGSNAEIQLNGLSGNAVRQYYDGIPLELLGGGISLNNIPVNSIDRIDVYKGVMPIDIGTDALAGGINVVPKEIYGSYLDASYEFGSFNTHVATVNGAKTIRDKVFLALNTFFNYSDNNFKMRNIETRILDENGFETFGGTQTIERFHNQHQSSFSELQFGANELFWADRIVISTGFSQRFDEIQHGARIGGRPAGDAKTDNAAFFQNLKYQKNFGNKFDFSYFGNYAFVKDNIRDSTLNLYNWFGEVEPLGNSTNGRELTAQPTLREGRTFVTVHRFSGKYQIGKNYEASLSNFFAYQRITGNDPVARRVPIDDPTTDPNTLPSELQRNILAGQLSGNWFDEKLEGLIFGKYYTYENSSSDFSQAGGSVIFEPIVRSDEQFGYGTGLKFSIDENIFFRAGYERAIRVPTSGEVFGNFITIAPNFGLEAESSDNLNLGLFYRYNLSNRRFASVQIDWFLRNQEDLIRLDVPNNPNSPAIFINQDKVQARGIEAAIKSRPASNFNVDLSITYQDVISTDETSTDYKKSIPNIPNFFYNLGARYELKSPFNTEDQVTFFGYYNYVQEFSLIFEGGIRNDENFIQTQNQIDAGLSYSLADTGFTFSLQVNNITNAEVFDNYRIPRPERNYRLKIRYVTRCAN